MQPNNRPFSMKRLPEMTEVEREARYLGFTDMPSDEELIARRMVVARAIAKTARAALVDAIVVTTSTGKRFNGDEVSQGRMARAIIALKENNVPATQWVLADNVPAVVTLAEFVEALTLAGSAQTAVWVIPT